MWRDIYVEEKLRDLSQERRKPAPLPASPASKSRLRPFARLTGRTLRRLGEGLESWATAAHQEQRWEQPRYERR
jgi:hypothetical protein